MAQDLFLGGSWTLWVQPVKLSLGSEQPSSSEHGRIAVLIRAVAVVMA